jgi:hypothetical protein
MKMSFEFALIRSAVFNSGWVQNISVSAIIMYSLVGAAKLNGIDPESYLRNVVSRIAEHPINRIEELLPRNLSTFLNTPDFHFTSQRSTESKPCRMVEDLTRLSKRESRVL